MLCTICCIYELFFFFFLLFPNICKSHIWTQLQSMHFLSIPQQHNYNTSPCNAVCWLSLADKLMQIGWLGQTDPSHRLTYNFNPLIPHLVLCLARTATPAFSPPPPLAVCTHTVNHPEGLFMWCWWWTFCLFPLVWLCRTVALCWPTNHRH